MGDLNISDTDSTAVLAALADKNIIFFDGDYTGVIDEVANIEAVMNANPGVPIFFGPGSLKITRALNPAGGQHAQMFGMGRDVTVFKIPAVKQFFYSTNHRDFLRNAITAAASTSSPLQIAVTAVAVAAAPDVETCAGTLTLTANAGNGETVTIGYKTYTFKTALTPSANEVLIGAAAADSVNNLIAAINNGTGSGTLYAATTKRHGNVTASVGSTTSKMDVHTVYGALTSTETMANGSFAAATLGRTVAAGAPEDQPNSGASTDNDQVHVLTVAVDTAYAFSYGDRIYLNSSTLYPETPENIRMGEEHELRWVDVALGKIYISGKLQADPATFYNTFTNINTLCVTKVDTTYRLEICGIGVEADGDWTDPYIATPGGRHAHALDVVGYPFAHVHHCRFEGLWEGGATFDVCPGFIFEHNLVRFLPNLGTANIATGTGNRLGYGAAAGNMSDRGLIQDNEFYNCRHAFTSITHPITDYDASDWYQAGANSLCVVKGNISRASYGVPWDCHEGAMGFIYIDNIDDWGGKGPQHGSYNTNYSCQDRGSNNQWINNRKINGGQNGIRITAVERLAGSVTKIKGYTSERMNSSQDTLSTTGNSSLTGGSTRSQAIQIDNMFGITNEPDVHIDGLDTDDVNVSLVAFGGPLKITASNLTMRRGGVPIELFGDVTFTCFDKPVFDFRDTLRTPLEVSCVKMHTVDDLFRPRAAGAKAIFLDGATILKNSAAKPVSFFSEGTGEFTAGTGCTLDLTISGAGPFTVTAATVNAGGSGYAENDLLVINGTVTTGHKATVRVSTVSGGAVLTVFILYAGSYSASPGTTGVATSALTAAKTYYLPELTEFNEGGVTKTTVLPTDESRFTKSTEVNQLAGSDLTVVDTSAMSGATNSGGAVTGGTFTPVLAFGQFQSYVNGGAHTLAPPATSTVMTIQVTNNASAGAITTSGFTKVINGADLTTTNGDDFFLDITKHGAFSHLNVRKLQ